MKKSVDKIVKVDIEKNDIKCEQLSLRVAREKDCKLLWIWHNEARKNFFNSKFIPYKEHKQWFEKELKSLDTHILILLDSTSEKIGQVKFDMDGENSEISISIEKKERNYGYGTRGLKLACQYAFHNFGIKIIVAHIKVDNEISKKVFEKVGFKNNGEVIFKDQSCCKFYFKKED